MLPQLLSPEMGITLLMGISSFGVALAKPVEARQTTETTNAAAVSTVTGYAHPLTLTPLTTLGAYQTPLSYASPPTAITVPTRPAAGEAAAATGVQAEAEDSSSSSSPASTSSSAGAVCTSIAGAYPTATVPNFCNPSAQLNAAGFAPARTDLPTATVTVGAVSNKLDCCVQCAGIFNCVAWRFVPVYTQTPNAHLPGGFDPWGRGDCEAVYHTGDPSNETSSGVIETAKENETASLCPNGKVGEMLVGGAGNATTNGTDAGSWMNLYYNGWNEGPCAEPVAPFESGRDAGRGDADDLCS
ncbi:uncharacterized protein GGS22DRAFT_50811 [Annulohypoxylon maeteangense]|uniref:uncharacterized protein n=1 Tax=Annulohypoxylon maeteangense TaxID=1927788 RepID=UPI00200807E8|nr:uncharacterized protein GGS22DRAFT_50811 [Annulohypoxylon maeteangense]KAI0882361.1 hypothetical protein GGS22DRAFT_50811 [Annulohypoxylon maeteangense]